MCFCQEKPGGEVPRPPAHLWVVAWTRRSPASPRVSRDECLCVHVCARVSAQRPALLSQREGVVESRPPVSRGEGLHGEPRLPPVRLSSCLAVGRGVGRAAFHISPLPCPLLWDMAFHALGHSLCLSLAPGPAGRTFVHWQMGIVRADGFPWDCRDQRRGGLPGYSVPMAIIILFVLGKPRHRNSGYLDHYARWGAGLCTLPM